MSFINKDWRNLTKALDFKHFQSNPKSPRSNGKIENIHSFLKRTMRKIMHSHPRIQWPEAIQMATHNHNTYPSTNNGYSPFLLHFGREDSNPLWNRLNPGNTYLLQNDVTASVHELHKLWKAHAKELKRNRSKKDNPNITSDLELHKGDRVIIMNYQPSGLTHDSMVTGKSQTSTWKDRSW